MMETVGYLEPTVPSVVQAEHERLEPAGREIVNAVVRAMDFDRGEYQERVTPSVHAAATDALFASLLVVHHGTEREFDGWCTEADGDLEVHRIGSDRVENVAWHRFEDRVVAATYHAEPAAARATLRRVAFDRLYRDIIRSDVE